MRTETEIKQLIMDSFITGRDTHGVAKFFKNHYPDVVDWLRSRFGADHSYTVSELCYCFVNGIQMPRCLCGNRVKFRGFFIGYRQYCSEKCRYSDRDAQERAKKVRDATVMKKYGVRNVFMLESMQDKARKSRLDRHGDEYYNNREKARKTCLDRYGSETPGGSAEIQKKIRRTCRSRFGSNSPFGDRSVQDKSKQTMLQRHGVEYAAQNPSIYAKVVATNKERYGCGSALENADVKKKIVESIRERYGVDNYSQAIECHLKKRHKYCSRYNNDVSFYSSWEAIVYDFCVERGVVPTIAPCSIKYTVDGKTHVYIPDFLINGHLVEIKGDHFIDVDGSWTVPYSKGEMEAEAYERLKRQFKAKSRCAKDNNVIVLSGKDIRDLDSSLAPLLVAKESCKDVYRNEVLNESAFGGGLTNDEAPIDDRLDPKEV